MNFQWSFQTWHLLHMTGLMLLFFGLGGVLIGHGSASKLKISGRILGFATHGVGLMLVLLTGIKMISEMGIREIPLWLYGKLLIWVILGVAISMARRKPQWGVLLTLVFIGLGALAGYLALFKPGL